MKRSGISRLAVGALLACEVGSINAGTASAASVIDAIPGVGAIKSAAAATGKFAKDNPILFSSIAMPFITKAFDLIPKYTKKAISYVKDTFFNTNDFCTYYEVTKNLKNNFKNVPGLKEAKKKSLKIGGNIAEIKSVNARSEDNGNGNKKQSHVVVFTNSNSPMRKNFVKNFSCSLYTGEPLVLDLTKCSSKSELSSALLPGKSDFFSQKSSDTSGDKLKNYKEKNEHGVVVLKLSPKGIEAGDGIFSELLRPGSNGMATIKGEKFEAGNLTFVAEIEGSIADPDSLKFLDFADRVDFPPEAENTEISKLVKNSFENSIEYWEECDVRVNSKILLKSICDTLSEAKDGSNETMQGLVDDFNRYMTENKGKFAGKKILVYYDKEKGEFNSFETLIGGWAKKGVKVNSKILLKSIYEKLKESKSNSVETIRHLANDFDQYMSKNENEFAGKKVSVYYDKEKGEFNIKKQKETPEDKESIQQELPQNSDNTDKIEPKIKKPTKKAATKEVANNEKVTKQKVPQNPNNKINKGGPKIKGTTKEVTKEVANNEKVTKQKVPQNPNKINKGGPKIKGTTKEVTKEVANNEKVAKQKVPQSSGEKNGKKKMLKT